MDTILKNILSNQFGVSVNELSNATHIIEDLKADSLDIIEIIMSIEKGYKIKIEEEDYQDRSTIGDLLELIKIKLS